MNDTDIKKLYEKGLNSFKQNNFEEAKVYFIRVISENENYLDTKTLLKHIDFIINKRKKNSQLKHNINTEFLNNENLNIIHLNELINNEVEKIYQYKELTIQYYEKTMTFFIKSIEKLIEKNSLNDSLKLSLTGLEFYKDSPYLLYYSGVIFYLQKNISSCINVLENALNEIKRNNVKELISFNINDLEYKINSILKLHKKKLISACIIAKNEESYIENCINSVKNIVDEVIVLDTGSNDYTKEISIESGAKVFSFEWNDNFSQAKNRAIELANSDWVFIIDADEQVTSNISRNQINDLLSRKDIAGYNITRIETNKNQKISLTRIFRKHHEIYYEGAIHEQIEDTLIKFCDKHKFYIAYSNIELEHYGYLPDVMEKKATSERNIRILEKSINENIEKPSTIIYYQIKLAIEYLKLGKAKEEDKQLALNLFSNIYEKLKSGDIFENLSTFPPLIQFATEYGNILYEKGDYQLSGDVLNLALLHFPYNLMVNYHKGNLYYYLKKYQKAIETYKNTLIYYKTNKYDVNSLVDFKVITTYIPYMLGICHEFLNEYDEALHWLYEIEKNDSDFTLHKEIITNILSKKSDNSEDDVYKVKIKYLRNYYNQSLFNEVEKLIEELNIYFEKSDINKIKKYNSFSEFFDIYSDILLFKGNIDKSLELLLNGITYFDFPILNYKIAKIYSLKGDYNKSIEYFNKCVELGKNKDLFQLTDQKEIMDSESYYGIGYCFLLLGKHDLAKEYLNKCLKYNPNNEIAIMTLNNIN